MASDKTQARRDRVRELLAKNDRRVGEVLVEEGFFGKLAKTPVARARQLNTARRTALRDREWWRVQWRHARKLTAEDHNCSTEEYIARLETRIEQLEEVLDNPGIKATPRVQALSELRQIEQAIAKARGVDAVVRDDRDNGDDGPVSPTVLVLDLSNCTPAAKSRIRDGNGG